MTTMRVETDRMMPRSIRKERILCTRRVSSATLIGSRSMTRRFMREFPLSLLRADNGKGFPPRRLESALRGTDWKRYHYPWLSRRGAKIGVGNSAQGRRLGAFAGVCYTNWAGSGIV